MHTTMSFDLPSKHVVANVDITSIVGGGAIDAFSCGNAFGMIGSVMGASVDAQIEKGLVCVKEGGVGREEWFVDGWDADVWLNRVIVTFN